MLELMERRERVVIFSNLFFCSSFFIFSLSIPNHEIISKKNKIKRFVLDRNLDRTLHFKFFPFKHWWFRRYLFFKRLFFFYFRNLSTFFEFSRNSVFGNNMSLARAHLPVLSYSSVEPPSNFFVRNIFFYFLN